MKSLLTLLTLGASLLSASAQVFTNFTVSLSGRNEFPTNNSPGIGGGTVTLNLTNNTLTLNNIFFSGLVANWSQDHFHAPAGPGTNMSVIYSLVPFTTPGPSTSTTGLISGVLTLTNGALGFTIAQQIAQLESGLWYLNVHSSTFPGGEIRGQVLPVPEPSVVVLSSAALGLLVLRWRRNRR